MVLSGVRVLCEGTTVRAGLSVTGMLLGRRCRTGQSSTTSAPALPAAGRELGTRGFVTRKKWEGKGIGVVSLHSE